MDNKCKECFVENVNHVLELYKVARITLNSGYDSMNQWNREDVLRVMEMALSLPRDCEVK